MHSLTVALPALALAATAAAGTVSAPFTRRAHPAAHSLTKRDGSLDLEAVNNITGGGYYAEFEVGTPGQKLGFLLDTGSSDTWVNSVDADLCNSAILQQKDGFCMTTFNEANSKSFKIVDRNGFDITYLDGRNIQGDYFNDTVTIGDSHVENQQLGLATTSVRPTGIMGLGFSGNVAAKTPYATIIDNMLSQGLINSAAFSLYLNDLNANSGTILFGGVDSQKFVGDLAKLPLIKDPQTTSNNITSFTIDMKGFSVKAPGDDADAASAISSFSATTILDSGSTISLLPDDKVEDIWKLFDVRNVQGLQLPFVDCDWNGDKGKGYSVNYEFDGKTISVPVAELAIDSFADAQDELKNDPTLGPLLGDFSKICMFGIASTSDYGIDSNNWALLGDTFLRSAYVVYDLGNEQLGLAQANLNSDKTKIVEFDASSHDLPDVTGVKSQEGTATSHPPSSTPTATTSSASPTSTKADQATGDDGTNDNAAGHLSPGFSAVATLMILMGTITAIL